MKQKIKHYLTDHASRRLAERSILTEAEFLAMADCCSVLVYRPDPETYYKMIWSGKDRNGYVLVTDRITGIVVTVFTATHESGYPRKLMDASRKPANGHDVGASKVTSAMLEMAVLAAGADISEARDILDALESHEKTPVQPRAWHYRWMLRFLYRKPDGVVSSKVVTFGKAVEVQASPPDGMNNEAGAVVKAAEGWDAVLLLVERDSNEEVGVWAVTEASVA